MSMSKQRTKVVVRRLPPGLTEDAFKATIDKLLPPGTYNWFSYFQGKVSLRKTVLSRAYLNFVDPSAVYDFKAKFDGHAFITTKGSQFKCAVEYAPFQKVPNPPKKRNPLEGTIEQDAHYQTFLQTLEAGPELLPSAAVQREQQEKAAAASGGAAADNGAVKVTPIMEYLRNKYLNNPSLRLGGMRRNKGKAVAAPPVVAKATKVGSRAGAKGALAKQQGKDTVPAAAALEAPAAAGPSKGGKVVQAKGAAGVVPASQQQKQQKQQQQQQQQQKGVGVQGAPKLMPRPQQQLPQQSVQGQASRPGSAQLPQQQEGRVGQGQRGAGRSGPGTGPSAARPSVMLMAKPPATQSSTPPSGSAAPSSRPAPASAAAGSAALPVSASPRGLAAVPTTTTAPPLTASSTPTAMPAATSAPKPAAAPAATAAAGAEINVPTSDTCAEAQPPPVRPARRVRAGFQSYQPKRRGGDEDG